MLEGLKKRVRAAARALFGAVEHEQQPMHDASADADGGIQPTTQTVTTHPTPVPAQEPERARCISFTRVSVTIPHLRGALRVVQITPSTFDIGTHAGRRASEATVRSVMSLIAAGGGTHEVTPGLRHRAVSPLAAPIGAPPMLVMFPELYADAASLIECVTRCPPGIIVIAGVAAEGEAVWHTGAEARDLVRALASWPGVNLAMDPEIATFLEVVADTAFVNLLLIAATEVRDGTSVVRVFLRPKIAGAPLLEESVDGRNTITCGSKLLLLDVEPPSGSEDDGITILPLLCSEYFREHSEVNETLTRALQRHGANGLSYKDAIDLIAVVNVCAFDPDTHSSWPREFERVIHELHGIRRRAFRTAFSVTTLTCPRQFSGKRGAFTGALIPIRFWAPRQRVEPPRGGDVLDIYEGIRILKATRRFEFNGLRAAPSEPTHYLRYDESLLLFGPPSELAAEPECTLFCWSYRMPRLHHGVEDRMPIVGAEVLAVIGGSTVFLDELTRNEVEVLR